MEAVVVARRSVDKDAPMFRVIVRRKTARMNPDWVRGEFVQPYWVYDGPEYNDYYGPYSSVGTARGVLTQKTLNSLHEPQPGVVNGWIERATVTWERVS